MRWLRRKLASFLWWTYPRGSVEYDIMVGLILAFLFLTPRNFFRDQPRPPRLPPVTISLLSGQHGHLYEIWGARRPADLALLLRRHLGHAVTIRKISTKQIPAQPGSAPVTVYLVWTP